MTLSARAKLIELLPELEELQVLDQVLGFSMLCLELLAERKNCQLRANVGGGRGGSFNKLVKVDVKLEHFLR